MLLQVCGVGKSFKKKAVLNNVSFNASAGEIIGIIGPNGSGKTTLLNILTGALKPEAGEYRFAKEAKTGASISRKGFFEDMSVKRNLMLFAALEGVKYAERIEERNIFQIDYFGERYGILSAGMKQRAALTIPFWSHKDIILLDEPTNHLDIDSILVLRNEMTRLKAEGVTFVITSHFSSDFEKTCDRILFMKQGSVLYENSCAEILAQYGDIENAYGQITNRKER